MNEITFMDLTSDQIRIQFVSLINCIFNTNIPIVVRSLHVSGFTAMLCFPCHARFVLKDFIHKVLVVFFIFVVAETFLAVVFLLLETSCEKFAVICTHLCEPTKVEC